MGACGKSTPSSALMAVVKEFKLHSLIRSQQREDFEKRVKEKETEVEAAERERLVGLKRKEEEEIRKIRQ